MAYRTGLYASSDSGYKVTGNVTVYKPVRYGSPLPALPFSGRTTLVACTATPDVDAVIPVSVTLTNATPKVPGGLGLSIFGFEPNGLTGVEGDYISSDGPHCSDGFSNADAYLAQVTWPNVVAGGTVRFDLFVILNGYYSPRYPNGNPALSGLETAIDLFMGPNAQDTMSQSGRTFRIL